METMFEARLVLSDWATEISHRTLVRDLRASLPSMKLEIIDIDEDWLLLRVTAQQIGLVDQLCRSHQKVIDGFIVNAVTFCFMQEGELRHETNYFEEDLVVYEREKTL